jgi:hypothetical protein
MDQNFRDRQSRVATPASLDSSAIWFDFDNDGKLDLFVCRFVDYFGSEETRVRQQLRLLENYYSVPRIFDAGRGTVGACQSHDCRASPPKYQLGFTATTVWRSSLQISNP